MYLIRGHLLGITQVLASRSIGSKVRRTWILFVKKLETRSSSQVCLCFVDRN